jgi:hypothetical protein
MTNDENELRLAQVRADIARKTQELMFEPRKYRVQFAMMMAAVVVASAAFGGFVVTLSRAPPPIIIQLPHQEPPR